MLPANEIELISIHEAAEILGLHRTQAVAELGKPDKIVHSKNNKEKYLYFRCRAEEIRRQRECKKCQQQNAKGSRSCYHCRNRFSPCQLTNGICTECQARKLVKNFACHGDVCKFPFDCERVNILSMIVAEYQLEEYYRQNPDSTAESDIVKQTFSDFPETPET